MKRLLWGFALGAAVVLLAVGFGASLGWVIVEPRPQILLGQLISGIVWPAGVTRRCSMDTCFDRARCGASPADFKLYVYPEEDILDSNMVFSIKDPAVRERERRAFKDIMVRQQAADHACCPAVCAWWPCFSPGRRPVQHVARAQGAACIQRATA
jgi:hypothetical protein